MWTCQVYGQLDKNGPCKNTQNITKHGVYKDATEIKK